MKIEISLKDLITWMLIAVLIVLHVLQWVKWGTLKLESQVYANTKNIQTIDSYLFQMEQARKQQPIPKIGEFSLTPKGEQKEEGEKK